MSVGEVLLRRFPPARALEVRDFRLLWLGESISMVGSQFSSVAWAWLIFQLTGSGLALGTVLLVGDIPRVVLMLAAGALTDRFSPWKVSLAANLISGATLGILSVLTLTHLIHLWHVYLASLIFGAMGAFFFPAVFALIPRALPPEQLNAGNALMESTNGLTSFIGPALAGVLIAGVGRNGGVSLIFALDAGSFAVAALALQFMSVDCKGVATQGNAAGTPSERHRLLRSILEGLRLAWRDPGLRTFLLLLAVNNLAFYGPYRVGLAALAAHRFAGGAAALGTLYGAWGAGALVGTVVAGFVGRLRRYGLLMLAGALVQGVAFLLIGFAPNLVVAILLVVILGVEGGVGNVVFGTWLQVRTDPSFLGRVTSLVGLANLGLTPLSYALSGALVDLNPTLMFALAGGLVLAAVGLAGISATVRGME